MDPILVGLIVFVVVAGGAVLGGVLGRALPDSAPAQTASIYEDTSLGWGNYNAAYLSFTFRDWHGITARSNLTWSKAMGTLGYTQSTSSTTVLNPFNIGQGYGVQPFDYKFVYTLSVVYQPKFFTHSNNIVTRTALSGWNFCATSWPNIPSAGGMWPTCCRRRWVRRRSSTIGARSAAR